MLVASSAVVVVEVVVVIVVVAVEEVVAVVVVVVVGRFFLFSFPVSFSNNAVRDMDDEDGDEEGEEGDDKDEGGEDGGEEKGGEEKRATEEKDCEDDTIIGFTVSTTLSLESLFVIPIVVSLCIDGRLEDTGASMKVAVTMVSSSISSAADGRS